jgi:hypothetical protein
MLDILIITVIHIMMKTTKIKQNAKKQKFFLRDLLLTPDANI